MKKLTEPTPSVAEANAMRHGDGAAGAIRAAPRWQLALAALIVVGVNAAFLFSYWNKFLAPSVSGMFLELAERLLHGVIPYKDLYVVYTPFYIFKTAILIKLFGPRLEMLRLVEIIYRLILGVILLLWLARIARLRYALLGAIAAIIVFSSDPGDSLTSYHEEAIFWAVIAGFLLSSVNWDQVFRKRDLLLIAAAGLCSSICFFTKQTAGGGVTLAALTAIIGLSFGSRRLPAVWQRLGAYIAGWAIPAAALFWWLAAEGALRAFFDAILFDGPSAKGSVGVIFTRVFVARDPVGLAHILYLPLALACVVVVAILARRAYGGAMSRRPSSNGAAWKLAAIAVLCFAALAAGYRLGYPHALGGQSTRIITWSVLLGFFGSLGLVIRWTILLIRRGLDATERQGWILALVSVWLAYTLSWSFGAWGPMALPSLGLVVAVLLESLGAGVGRRVLKYAVVAVVPLLLLTTEHGKVACPFGWNRWQAPPIRQATAVSDQPILKGIRMDPRIAQVTDEITRTIQTYSRPGEPVFIYAFQPLWYVLADRWPPTFAQVHYFDITPDNICREDTARILKAQPPVFIDFAWDPELLSEGEKEFRGGKPSGQRYLHDRVYRMLASDYRLEASFSYPANSEPVRIYVRKDRLPAAAH